MTEVEKNIARFYAPLIFRGVLRGESALCVWFPGSGKYTILYNILHSKEILEEVLGRLYGRLKIIHLLDVESEQDTADAVLSKYSVNSCAKLIENGEEILFVVNWLERLPEPESKRLLRGLAKMVLSNRARIHTILNFHNKMLFEKFLLENPDCSCLTQTVTYVPILKGDLLTKFIRHYESVYDFSLSPTKQKEIEKLTGGILSLTKELVRSGGQNGELDLKFKAMWHDVPSLYQQVIIDPTINSTAREELEKLGVIPDLKIFQEKYFLLAEKPERLLITVLTTNEKKLWGYLRKNKGKLLTKDQVAKIFWDGDFSDWQIDQAISRFRKKLFQSGFSNTALVTSKGKGYRWLA